MERKMGGQGVGVPGKTVHCYVYTVTKFHMLLMSVLARKAWTMFTLFNTKEKVLFRNATCEMLAGFCTELSEVGGGGSVSSPGSHP